MKTILILGWFSCQIENPTKHTTFLIIMRNTSNQTRRQYFHHQYDDVQQEQNRMYFREHQARERHLLNGKEHEDLS